MDPAVQQVLANTEHNLSTLTLSHNHLQQHMMQAEQQNFQLHQQMAQLVGSLQNHKSPYDKIASGIKPPVFSGDRSEGLELDTWIFQIKEYFKTINLTDDEQKKCVQPA